MIRHVVMWKFNKADKEKNMQKFMNMLNALNGEIPEIISMTVGTDILSSDWDMALVADFNSLDAMDAYKVHPKHKKVLEFGKAVISDRCAVDFEI